MQCPQCDEALRKKSIFNLVMPVCTGCNALWVDGSNVNSFFDTLKNTSIQTLQQSAAEENTMPMTKGFCSTCNFVMETVLIPGSLKKFMKCSQCGGIWIPIDEIHTLSNLYNKHNRQIFAALTDLSKDKKTLQWSDTYINYVMDENPTRTAPVTTYALIAVNVLVFLIVFFSPLVSLFDFMMVPSLVIADVPRYGFTVITSMFMHADFGHILGNMWALYMFGDNVEDRLGKTKFLILYFAGGLFGSLCYLATNSTSSIPVLGASGAISSIMGAYLILFPNANIKYNKIFFFFPYKIRVPAWFVIGGYFLFMQVFGLALNWRGVAWVTHLMSLAFGVLVTLILRLSNKL